MKKIIFSVVTIIIISSFFAETALGLFGPRAPPPLVAPSGAGLVPLDEYFYNNTMYFFFNETLLNATITALMPAPAGGGGVSGTGYLYNNSFFMYLNETRLNNTVNTLISLANISVNASLADSRVEGSGYLYNDSTFMYLNESQLNATIDARDSTGTDTRVEGSGYLYNDSSFMYLNESQLNTTISALDQYEPDTDTRVEGSGYLYNDSTYVYLNETTLNTTISALDQYEPDTHAEGSGYLYNDSTSMYLNETALNATISALDTDTRWNTTLDAYLYNDTSQIYFNESLMNDTVEDRFGLREENISINVVGGTGTNITLDVAYPSAEILQVAVFPTSSNNNYRFEAYGTGSLNAVDTDRKVHVGDWIVAHRGTVLYGESITLNITSANIDEQFTVRIRWRP